MTDDYKNTILKYLTGKLNIESGKNEPILEAVIPIENNLEEFIKQYYPDLDERFSFALGCSRGDYIILWGNDFNHNLQSPEYGYWKKSFVVVTDKKFTPVKFIDTYSSGMPLQTFILLNEKDNGQGRIFGIEVINEKNVVKKRRIVVINDFTVDNFDIKLLASWDLPKHNGYDIDPTTIIKNPNEGKYAIYYNEQISETYEIINNGGVVEFINNVGSANEWNFYDYAGTEDVNFNGACVDANWNNDTFQFIIFAFYDREIDDKHNAIDFIVLKQNDDAENKSMVKYKTISLPSECKNVETINESKIIGKNVLALLKNIRTNNGNVTYVIRMNIDTEQYKIFYSKEDYIDGEDEDPSKAHYNSDTIELYVINNQFYYTRNYQDYYLTVGETSEIEYIENKQYLSQIFENEVYEFLIRDYGNTSVVNFLISQSVVFNLVNIVFIYKNIIYKVVEIFNVTNYNGRHYENINSLVPKYVNLYSPQGGEADEIVFSRNLYNKIVNENTTQSTVEIPNTYLNDVTITSENLIGETEKTLISNSDNIEKNIYETLLLNFYNTINIRNSNDPQNEIVNLIGASRLNKSMSNDIDYNNCKAIKLKTYYEDNTSTTRSFNDLEIINQGNLSNYTFTVTVPNDKNITKFEILSNDEQTVYQTIENMNLIKNRTYVISQDCEII